MSHYDSITKIKICYALWRSGLSPEKIPDQLHIHRATVYRWLKQFETIGRARFIQDYQNAKNGHRQSHKTPMLTKLLIYETRKNYRDCCGEKIKYFLKQNHGIDLSVATIYRVLNERFQLSSKWKKKIKRGQLVRGTAPRESLQTDTVDFGEIFAYTCIDTFTKEASVVLKTTLDSTAGQQALEQQLAFFKEIKHIQRDGGYEFMAEWEFFAQKHIPSIRTSRPYKKNDQAFIERFNEILRKECLGYAKYTKKHLPMLQKQLDEFLDYYHNERPHLSLNMLTPQQFSMSHLT
ncbi:transposase [Candidatus Falkowbacteria bacterium]|nr:transposase [Candidatus Falkowbacteria bacterium]